MADIYYDTTNNKVVGLNLKEKTSDIDMVRIADEILPNITKIVTKKESMCIRGTPKEISYILVNLLIHRQVKSLEQILWTNPTCIVYLNGNV